ncbi:MFS transporter [Sulfolobales archaeon HS-7]|nr:MFS transporter [Sulfolobales archaeon HS-7]
MHYKWVALSNTTLGVLMASINGTILIIALPAIFRGIDINPLTSFEYLLWILFGFNIVTATLLVTFGRLSDMYGRVRLYNMGFLVFTIGSILLYLTPGTGDTAALEIIIFRIVQGIGAAFLFSNSAAILTDAFPYNERGKALGINQVAGLAGSLIGLVLGGVLAAIYWRYVFLVSVPVGIVGTIWSYLKLKEVGKIRRNRKIDVWGNATFAAGLTLILIGITYGLIPYGNSVMGWYNPWVMASLTSGVSLLVAFPFIEMRVPDPMVRLDFFKIRSFAAGNFAALLSATARGGVMIILVILLQGIWLPLHGYSYASTPFWAGVYLIPLSLGFVTMGPLSGWLSDRYGARVLATVGMAIAGACFLLLATLPYNFNYLEFALIIYVMGIGNGMFASPNTASIMNSIPAEHRGTASGMRSTFQNTGQTISIALFFTIVILAMSYSLPLALSHAVPGQPQLDAILEKIPPTGALFSAFLGYNPMKAILSQLPPSVVNHIPSSVITTITARTWFPEAIAPSFMSALRLSFYFAAGMSLVAAIASLLRGRVYVYEKETRGEKIAGETK